MHVFIGSGWKASLNTKKNIFIITNLLTDGEKFNFQNNSTFVYLYWMNIVGGIYCVDSRPSRVNAIGIYYNIVLYAIM